MKSKAVYSCGCTEENFDINHGLNDLIESGGLPEAQHHALLFTTFKRIHETLCEVLESVRCGKAVVESNAQLIKIRQARDSIAELIEVK